MTEPAEPTIDQLTADRDLWRARYEAAHEVILEVEHLFDVGIMGRAGPTVTVGGKALDELQNAFDAWRKFVEGGVPALWMVAGDDPKGFELDESETPF